MKVVAKSNMAAPVSHLICCKYKLILQFFVLLCLVYLSATIRLDSDSVNEHIPKVCALSSCSEAEIVNTSVVLKQCKHHNYTLNRRCCVEVQNDSSVIVLGLDLSRCAVESTALLKPLKHLRWIVLEENPLNSTDFEGLSDIDYLSLPPFLDCPGGYDAWGTVNYTSDVTICRDELDTCRSQNITCPESVSSCYNNGPGASQCLCNDGLHGYKCLRTNYFPYILYILTLFGLTLIISVFMWSTQRIRVKRKKER